STYAPDARRMAVTELLLQGQTMSMVWSPERPGGWIFHCHLLIHATREAPIDRRDVISPPEGHEHGDPDGHALTGMNGLVLGVTVTGATPAPDARRPTRRLRLFVQSDSQPGDTVRHFAYVLQRGGAEPRADSLGRLAGARLVPLAQLGRPRVDVVLTLSGIFRDLLPLQVRLLAEAALLAAEADEPPEMNAVRRHALAFQAAHGGTIAQAALRVFGNAEGAYGSNVNHLLEHGAWEEEDELAEAYLRRKGFAYGVDGKAVRQDAVLAHVLGSVEAAYQNLDSVELGVTAVDHYFDTLGGISRAVQRARGGGAAPVYLGDQTRGEGTVRTLAEQVALETRTRALNPKWYEALLAHGHEGVRHIEAQVTNTMGWSATTGQVAPWVYQHLAQTFMLDPAMRERLAALNPTASARIANRLLEAQERKYWAPDSDALERLRRAGEELEDRLEGVSSMGAAAA
ncbi:MAG TPA: cobaltochelatase subunit CobN, partial [Actinomycetota bacterium]